MHSCIHLYKYGCPKLMSEVQRDNWSFKHFKLKVIDTVMSSHEDILFAHSSTNGVFMSTTCFVSAYLGRWRKHAASHFTRAATHHKQPTCTNVQDSKWGSRVGTRCFYTTSHVRIRISTTSHARVRINITSHDVTLFQSLKSVCISHKMCNKAVCLRVSPCVLKLATC